MKTRKKFKEILEQNRISSSEISWEKEKMVSDLRHLFFYQKNFPAVNAMGIMKKNSLLLAAKLNPAITIGINSSFQIGIFFITNGEKNLHFPLGFSSEFVALHESKF